MNSLSSSFETGSTKSKTDRSWRFGSFGNVTTAEENFSFSDLFAPQNTTNDLDEDLYDSCPMESDTANMPLELPSLPSTFIPNLVRRPSSRGILRKTSKVLLLSNYCQRATRLSQVTRIAPKGQTVLRATQ